MKKILFVLFAAVFAVSANAQEKEKGRFLNLYIMNYLNMVHYM